MYFPCLSVDISEGYVIVVLSVVINSRFSLSRTTSVRFMIGVNASQFRFGHSCERTSVRYFVRRGAWKVLKASCEVCGHRCITSM